MTSVNAIRRQLKWARLVLAVLGVGLAMWESIVGECAGNGGRGGFGGGCVMVGGVPFEIQSGDHEAWGGSSWPNATRTRFELLIAPQAGASPPADWGGYPWRAEVISEPRRMQFRRADGTLTPALEMDWECGGRWPMRDSFAWSDDGLRVMVLDHNRGDGMPEFVIGERWCVATLAWSVAKGVGKGLPGSILVLLLVVLVTHPATWIRGRSHECPECCYDLRGCREPGCPECGWSRIPATRSV